MMLYSIYWGRNCELKTNDAPTPNFNPYNAVSRSDINAGTLDMYVCWFINTTVATYFIIILQYMEYLLFFYI